MVDGRLSIPIQGQIEQPGTLIDLTSEQNIELRYSLVEAGSDVNARKLSVGRYCTVAHGLRTERILTCEDGGDSSVISFIKIVRSSRHTHDMFCLVGNIEKAQFFRVELPSYIRVRQQEASSHGRESLHDLSAPGYKPSE